MDNILLEFKAGYIYLFIPYIIKLHEYISHQLKEKNEKERRGKNISEKLLKWINSMLPTSKNRISSNNYWQQE